MQIQGGVSLKKNLKKYHKISLPVNKETPACICMEGSYTVEAVVVIPFFVAFMVILLFFFRVLQVQQEVGNALMETARELAIISYQKELLPTSGCIEAKTMFLTKYKNQETEDFIDGGKWGISLLKSDLSGEYVDLKAEYNLPLPVGFFGVRNISLCQRVKCRKWIGRDYEAGQKEELVYITPYGEAYHQNKNCRYLDLSVRTAPKNRIEKLRNKNGEKYYACSKCMNTKKVYKIVYITDYGNHYHGKISCRDLKRTVIAVRKQNVGNRHACSSCGREIL